MKYAIALLIFFNCLNGSGQSLTAKVSDPFGKAIPFATIQTGKNSGVITNEEGFFTINMDELSSTELTISCLGFSPKTMSINEIKASNNNIVLQEYIDQLDQVTITKNTLDVKTIIATANKNLTLNYANENRTYKLFFRNTEYNNFSKLQFKITKASGFKKKELTKVNSSLDSLAGSIKKNKTVRFKDYLADLYLLNKENSKMNVLKATQLIDERNNVSTDQIQEKAQTIFLKYLDTTKTYKLKTGILKIEDSLSLQGDSEETKKEPSNTYLVENLRNESHELLHTSQIYDGTLLRELLDANLYNHTIDDITFFNNELVYILDYKPKKSRAKYKGKLYISDDTFAILKAEYTFAEGKRGDKLNLKLLLGIKFIENIRKGTIIFTKDATDRYKPQFLKEEFGSYFYVNRPLKFIENSPNKTKVGFNFLVEGTNSTKNEILFISEEEMPAMFFSEFIEDETVHYQKLNAYDASIWQSYNVIAPLEEMKSFRAEN